MDLSFSKMLELKGAGAMPPGALRVAALPVLLAAAAAHQAASPTAHALASVLRGQDRGNDMIQALTDIFAPRHGDRIDVASLAGQFHPGTAAMLEKARMTMTVGTV